MRPSIPIIASSHAALKPNGSDACSCSIPLNPNSRHERERPRVLQPDERQAILALGHDLERVWSAPTTTDSDRKELLRALLKEVIIDIHKHEQQAHLTLRWRAGLLSELDVTL